MADDWRDRAKCRGMEPNQFHDDTRFWQLRQVCRLCPVRTACLADALAANDDFGLRGGVSGGARRAIRRGRRRRSCPACHNRGLRFGATARPDVVIQACGSCGLAWRVPTAALAIATAVAA